MIVYAIHREWIIINIPGNHSGNHDHAISYPTKLQKKVTFYYWHNHTWHHETSSLVWTSANAQNIQYLINSWLSLLHDEKIITKKVALQTALLNTPGTELYLSFDRSLFSKESSTHDRWMIIEGLLKTLRENTITPNSVRFLIDHQQMTDSMLDFSNPWPLFGFM